VETAASVDLDRWQREFDEMMLRNRGRGRPGRPRAAVAGFIAVRLMAGPPRTNCWTIAETCRETRSRAMPAAVVDRQSGMPTVCGGPARIRHEPPRGDPDEVLSWSMRRDVKKGIAHRGGAAASTPGHRRAIGRTASRVYLTYATPVGYAFMTGTSTAQGPAGTGTHSDALLQHP